MSSEVSHEEVPTEVVYEAEVEMSSEELPMEDWSSLVMGLQEENLKRLLFDQGLYRPGSGELCSKYICMSASSVLRHPYFNYPAVADPGIKEALLNPEETITFADNGQALYLARCKDMNQCPVMIFYRGLLMDTIDLKYYCVDPFGVRPMAMALSYNRNVTILNLTDNFLNDDACYHLGEMLTSNSTLRELNLSGCKIGPTGAKLLFSGLHLNRGLRTLNLNKNFIGNIGIQYFSYAIIRGIDVREVFLSYNNINGKAANFLAEAFETYNKFTHLDISWNSLFNPVADTCTLLARLSESKLLQELNLAWNSLSGGRIGIALKSVFKIPSLRILNLSNNKLFSEGIQNFIGFMAKAKKMVTLNLSYNPLTPEDALRVLQKMKLNTVKIQNLLMDNVFVDGAFLVLLDEIKRMKTKQSTVITYGGVIGGFQAKGPDMRELVLNRVEYLTKSKKKKVDIALVVMQMVKDNIEVMSAKEFEDFIVSTGAYLDSDLISEIINTFPGPKSAKNKTINISSLFEYVKRKWPDRKLPPTPPPEPVPEPFSPALIPENLKKKDKYKK